jgi:hypothetical protein
VYEPALGGIMWTMTRERGIPPGELELLDAYWRAANYLSVGQIYLLDNPLLRESLRLEQLARGEGSRTDTMHIVVTSVNSLLICSPLGPRRGRSGSGFASTRSGPSWYSS